MPSSVPGTSATACESSRPTRSNPPVISVGNLTTGGTGKTPLVAWLAEHLRETGHRVGLLSRGYRGEDNGTGNDEKKLLEALCGDIPHVQDPDRVSGADQAINAHECNV
ncbi:MAG: hypothetical protein CM1200mP2_42380 [Planctomycetaceae bacterium]|nr:MAG: hypothetical protein CM1200mP2_42380 [Planctomycetaceae bacterium]